MAVKKQNVAVTTWQYMRAQTIHASIVIIEISAFLLVY